MTVRQEAHHLVNKLPDDIVIFLVELLKRIPLTSTNAPDTGNTSDTGAPVQFGLGKGMITDPAGFDLWDAEISAMFEDNLI